MKKIIVDIDNTLTRHVRGTPYSDMPLNVAVRDKLRFYRDSGFQIVLYTARNMRTYQGNIGLINTHTAPVLLEWLAQNDVPYDEIIYGKPWCGLDGFYVDDKAIRPDEFENLSYEKIRQLIGS